MISHPANLADSFHGVSGPPFPLSLGPVPAHSDRVTVPFLLTSLIVVATPGTGVLLTIAAGLRHGARRGAVTALGCTLGIVPHLIAAITGAAALLRAGGLAFEALKILGVGYLLVMAWTTWRDTGALAVPAMVERDRPTMVRAVVTAVLANLLNPKLTIFFFAFLPQFVDPGSTRPILDMLFLSAVFMGMTLVVFVLYGFFAAAARTRLIERPVVVDRLRKVFAVSFLGLAGKLATTR
ncbi:MAG: hypothetical protein QG622_2834 [Actinomycetota bacterium]|nr:hypothetical protein [Actinomycetota bacterium]